MPSVSVLIPTFQRASFLPRAIASVFAQTHADWELIVIDDGSTDHTVDVVSAYLTDERVRLERLGRNLGMGAALDRGLDVARAPLVAYLPSDDVWFREHLATVLQALAAEPDAVASVSGVRHVDDMWVDGRIPDEPLQLVQVAHRRTDLRWPERSELVSDDLGALFWDRLFAQGRVVETRRITCEWVAHPGQLHRVIRESEGGGLNPFRSRFHVEHPLRFQSTEGTLIDEPALYERFRDVPAPSGEGLTILLVGELAYNPERILALEARGHRLYGLWSDRLAWFMTVGPLPFGHVTDVPLDGWLDAVRTIRPDVIYALLNWESVRLADRILQENPGIPFVWHFKEGPFACIERGTWPELAHLDAQADVRVYVSDEAAGWFRHMLGPVRGETMVIDGDLPLGVWFEGGEAPPLSGHDGEVHTVVPGRPIGLRPRDVRTLADAGVHLHFHGKWLQYAFREWVQEAVELAPEHLHLHPHVERDRWRSVLSRYDAGWLHFFESENDGDLGAANWHDLNVPARLATYAAAGLPVLQRDNTGSAVATHRIAREGGFGLDAGTIAELAATLRDRSRLDEARAAMDRARMSFAFDAHVEALEGAFELAIARRRTGRRPMLVTS